MTESTIPGDTERDRAARASWPDPLARGSDDTTRRGSPYHVYAGLSSRAVHLAAFAKREAAEAYARAAAKERQTVVRVLDLALARPFARPLLRVRDGKHGLREAGPWGKKYDPPGWIRWQRLADVLADRTDPRALPVRGTQVVVAQVRGLGDLLAKPAEVRRVVRQLALGELRQGKRTKSVDPVYLRCEDVGASVAVYRVAP